MSHYYLNSGVCDTFFKKVQTLPASVRVVAHQVGEELDALDRDLNVVFALVWK